jgi:hypothetical protein
MPDEVPLEVAILKVRDFGKRFLYGALTEDSLACAPGGLDGLNGMCLRDGNELYFFRAAAGRGGSGDYGLANTCEVSGDVVHRAMLS